jgi:serine protease Do
MRQRAIGRIFPFAVLVALPACRESGPPDSPPAVTAAVWNDTGPLPPFVDSTTAALTMAFRRAASRALPGVVFVEVQTARRSNGPLGDLLPPWVREGTGSGFAFRSDGYILTNNHVVQEATRVTVVLRDRREFAGRVVGRDPNTDVAVLHIDATDLPVLEPGDSDPLDVGDWVIALGYPLQLGSTATAGIVSAKGRNLRILGESAEAQAPLEHFIQTDAAINVGNSGGPLVDLEGRVVGMNSAIASPTGFYAGYGFAIPINLVRRVAEDLIEFGEVHRPRLGVAVEDIDPADAEVYRLECVCGAEVILVTEDTPAARAGILLGDVILAVDDEPVDRSGELLERLARNEPGQEVKLALVRSGRPLEVRIQLGEFEPSAPRAQEPPPVAERGLGRLGFAAAELTAEFARRLGMDRGVVVSAVDPYHPAGRTRLQEGLVATLEDLRRIADTIQPGDAVSLIVRALDGGRTIINYRVRG